MGKRARRRAVQTSMAVQDQQRVEFERALSWARFHSPHGYRPRQASIFLCDKNDFAQLDAAMNADGILQQRFQGVLSGYRLLDGMSLAKVKTFPIRLWVGLGCEDCR